MTSANRNFLGMKFKSQFGLEKGLNWINKLFKFLFIGRDNYEVISISGITL